MIRKKSKVKKVKKSLVYDAIKFKSPLEIYAYQQLKLAGIEFGYEVEKFILQPSFNFTNPTYRRVGSGAKKKMVYAEEMKILSITHKPDFTSKSFILETKGMIRADNVLIIKMFKNYLMFTGDKRPYFMAHSQKDVRDCIELIKKL